MTDRCPPADGSSPKTPDLRRPAADVHRPVQALHRRDGDLEGHAHDRARPDRRAATANNFVFLARWHYYDGIVFHRVIPGFVLQGGDPTGTGTGGPGYRFADELPKPGRYELGSLAMANAGPDTNGSQFFIISGPQGVALPPKYALFGKVVTGLDVVAAIDADRHALGQAHRARRRSSR